MSVTRESIMECLRQVYDPEIPISIVDLGLIYDVEISPDQFVVVKMTLTTPGCGLGNTISQNAAERIRALDGVAGAQVEIVWDPPWSQSKISPDGRKKLGMV